MTRGQGDLLDLPCTTLPFATPHRIIPAHPVFGQSHSCAALAGERSIRRIFDQRRPRRFRLRWLMNSRKTTIFDRDRLRGRPRASNPSRRRFFGCVRSATARRVIRFARSTVAKVATESTRRSVAETDLSRRRSAFVPRRSLRPGRGDGRRASRAGRFGHFRH